MRCKNQKEVRSYRLVLSYELEDLQLPFGHLWLQVQCHMSVEVEGEVFQVGVNWRQEYGALVEGGPLRIELLQR